MPTYTDHVPKPSIENILENGFYIKTSYISLSCFRFIDWILKSREIYTYSFTGMIPLGQWPESITFSIQFQYNLKLTFTNFFRLLPLMCPSDVYFIISMNLFDPVQGIEPRIVLIARLIAVYFIIGPVQLLNYQFVEVLQGYFVTPPGLEPGTHTLKVYCSSNWATRSYQILSILSRRF